MMPIVGDRRIIQWLTSQPTFTSADTRFSEAARSGDLGYTWGTYTTQGRTRRLAGRLLRAGLGPRAKRPVEAGPRRPAAAVTRGDVVGGRINPL